MALAARADIALGNVITRTCDYINGVVDAWRQPFTDFDERLADEEVRTGSLWDAEARAQWDRETGDGLADAAERGDDRATYLGWPPWSLDELFAMKADLDAERYDNLIHTTTLKCVCGAGLTLDGCPDYARQGFMDEHQTCAAPVSPPSGVSQAAGAAHPLSASEASADGPAADSSAQDAAAGPPTPPMDLGWLFDLAGRTGKDVARAFRDVADLLDPPDLKGQP